MWMSMSGEHTNLHILTVSKWVLWPAYRNHQIPMSYILDNLVGKPLHKIPMPYLLFTPFYYCHWLSYWLDSCFVMLIAASLIPQETFA